MASEDVALTLQWESTGMGSTEVTEPSPVSCSDSPFASRPSEFMCLRPTASQCEPTLDVLVPSELGWHELNSLDRCREEVATRMKISQGDGSPDRLQNKMSFTAFPLVFRAVEMMARVSLQRGVLA